MSLVIKQATDPLDIAACSYLRTIIFVQEQECPFADEFNEEDNQAINFIAWNDNLPIAMARYRHIDGTYKIERVCVDRNARGTGAGKKIMRHIIETISSKDNTATFKLSAQDQAIKFYEELGFSAYGEGYIEAGIPHHMMERK